MLDRLSHFHPETPKEEYSTGYVASRLDHPLIWSALKIGLALPCAIFLRVAHPLSLHTLKVELLIGYGCYGLLGSVIWFQRGYTRTFDLFNWLDPLWISLIVYASGGISSPYFGLYLLPILQVSFRTPRWCFWFVVFSMMGYSIAGLAAYSNLTSEIMEDFFVPRLLFLLVLGGLVTQWAGYLSQIKGRQELVRRMVAHSNPRFSLETLLQQILQILYDYHEADCCLLLYQETEHGNVRSFGFKESSRDEAEKRNTGDYLPHKMVEWLLALPVNAAFYFNRQRFGVSAFVRERPIWDIVEGTPLPEIEPQCRKIHSLLDSPYLLSVPVRVYGRMKGRWYLTTTKRRFTTADAMMLCQINYLIMPIIENVILIDRLAVEAADRERQRIALDIHDSLVQPYIGLQMGLKAVLQNFNNSVKKEDVHQLLEMANHGVVELRQYVHQLRNLETGDETLVAALRRFVSKFESMTGIEISVEAEAFPQINDRLKAELFQIACEGVYNIRRHTLSNRGIIKLGRTEEAIKLQILNTTDTAISAPSFLPRSIQERARLLGGNVEAICSEQQTLVTVTIPLIHNDSPS